MYKKTQRNLSNRLRRRSWLTLLIISGLSYNSGTLCAQETIATSGATSTGSGGTASYTIGQIAYTSIDASTGSIQQGVQQAYVISTVNSLSENDNINLNCSVYPNPTTDLLILSVENEEEIDYNYSLSTFEGQNIEHGQINSAETTINMTDLNLGKYLLVVSNSESVIKTFKIVKQ